MHSANDLREFDLKVLAKLPQLAPLNTVKKARRKILFVSATICVLLMACAISVLEFLQLPYVERGIALARRSLFS